MLDLSAQTWRHSFIAAGKISRYEGHPTTLRLPGTDTIFCVWCSPHGGCGGQLARSDDGGKTWLRLDHTLPLDAQYQWDCPSIYRLTDPQGVARLWIWSAWHGPTKQEPEAPMPSLLSEDDGKTWVARPPMDASFYCVMTFASIVPLDKPGHYMGLYHRRYVHNESEQLEVVQSFTEDGGFTWSAPKVICRVPGKNPCEPCGFWSPDHSEIAVVMRENTHKGCSLMIFSRDGGQTWTEAQDTAWELTGDRHACLPLPDGNYLLAFRDMAPESPTYGNYLAWLGTYEDIRKARPGKRIMLLRNYLKWDCGYSGLELLQDRKTIVATTYLKYWDDPRQHSVVCTRFTIDEIEEG